RLWRENPRVVVRLQPLQRATGGAAWSAVCVCLTLRAGYVVPGAASLSQQLQTVGTVGETVCDGVHQYYRRRQQPRCRIPVYLNAASLCEAAPRRNRATAATDSKYGSVLVAVRTVWC